MSKIHFHQGVSTLQLFYNQRVYKPISCWLFLLFLYPIDYQRIVASFRSWNARDRYLWKCSISIQYLNYDKHILPCYLSPMLPTINNYSICCYRVYLPYYKPHECADLLKYMPSPNVMIWKVCTRRYIEQWDNPTVQCIVGYKLFKLEKRYKLMISSAYILKYFCRRYQPFGSDLNMWNITAIIIDQNIIRLCALFILRAITILWW